MIRKTHLWVASNNCMTGRSIERHTCVQPVMLGLCPKRKNHPLCGWIFIYCDTGIHEARFCESKNGLRRSSRKGASAFADCGVGSTRNFSQNARSVRKMRERTVPLTKSHADTPVWVVSVFLLRYRDS